MTIKFNVERTSQIYRTYCVSWQINTARYHVWVEDGALTDVIHRNPIARTDGSYPMPGDADYFPHRALDGTAKANAGVMAQIKELIAAGALNFLELLKLRALLSFKNLLSDQRMMKFIIWSNFE